VVTRGFFGRRPAPANAHRIPPGQHEVFDFPVRSAGPTPRVALAEWKFTLKSGVRPVKQWSWEAFTALPRTLMTCDIHGVTTWSKLDTMWEGVLVDDILKDAGLASPTAHALAHSVDGYSTTVPTADLIDVDIAPHVTLVYSARTWNDVIFREELQQHEHTQTGLRVVYSITCDASLHHTSRREDFTRRLDAELVQQILAGEAEVPHTGFVCGNNSFVGTVANALVQAGLPPPHIRTERYGG